MIVIIDNDDQAIGNELQRKLAVAEWTSFWGEVTPVEHLAAKLGACLARPAIFAAGAAIERLALMVTYIRSLTAHPVIAVSHGGLASRIVQLVKVGATDVIDLDVCFDTQMRGIAENLRSNWAKITKPQRFKAGVTPAQRRVAALLLTGLTESDIATKLGLSYFTVHNHVKEIYRRYRVHSRLQFINAYRESNPFFSETMTRS